MLPSSPPISLLQIYTEFSAPLGTPLSQFYQGGPWVGTGGANANVPTAPPIGLLNLLGAAKGGTVNGFLATVSPSSVSNPSFAGGLIYTPSVTVSVSGNAGAVNYQWKIVSGDSAIHITSPTSATTTFSCYKTITNSYFATFQCTCTDAGGHTAISPYVYVSFPNTKNLP